MTASPPPTGLDIRNVFETPLRQFIPWLAIVLFIAFVGKQPGVVCVTPMAWLIALRVGNVSVARSRSGNSSSRKIEAALAGAVLGFLQGLLFAIIISQLEPINSDEQTKATALTIGMVIIGIVIGAILSFITAYLNEQRRKRSTS